MNVKELFREENNTNNEEGHGGIDLSRIQHLPLSSRSGSTSGDVRWCPSLALVETTGDPQSVAVSFRLGWSPLFCPAGFLSAQNTGVVHLMTQEDCQYLLYLPPEGAFGVIGRMGTLGHPQEALFNL